MTLILLSVVDVIPDPASGKLQVTLYILDLWYQSWVSESHDGKLPSCARVCYIGNSIETRNVCPIKLTWRKAACCHIVGWILTAGFVFFHYLLQPNIAQLRDRLCKAQGQPIPGQESSKTPYDRQQLPKGRPGPVAGHTQMPRVPAQQCYPHVSHMVLMK